MPWIIGILLHDSSVAYHTNGNKQDQILSSRTHSQTARKTRSTGDGCSFPSSLPISVLPCTKVNNRNWSRGKDLKEMQRKWEEKHRRRQLCINLPHQPLWWDGARIIHNWRRTLKLTGGSFCQCWITREQHSVLDGGGRTVPLVYSLSSKFKDILKRYFICQSPF